MLISQYHEDNNYIFWLDQQQHTMLMPLQHSLMRKTCLLFQRKLKGVWLDHTSFNARYHAWRQICKKKSCPHVPSTSPLNWHHLSYSTFQKTFPFLSFCQLSSESWKLLSVSILFVTRGLTHTKRTSWLVRTVRSARQVLLLAGEHWILKYAFATIHSRSRRRRQSLFTSEIYARSHRDRHSAATTKREKKDTQNQAGWRSTMCHLSCVSMYISNTL